MIKLGCEIDLGKDIKPFLYHWLFPGAQRDPPLWNGRTLPRPGCPAKLCNLARSALVKKVTKNLSENLLKGQPFQKFSINQAFYGSVARQKPLLIEKHMALRPWEQVKNDSLVWWGNNWQYDHYGETWLRQHNSMRILLSSRDWEIGQILQRFNF